MSTGKVENISSREGQRALLQKLELILDSALRATRVIRLLHDHARRAGARIEGQIRLRVEGQEDMATRRKRFAVRKDWSRQR